MSKKTAKNIRILQVMAGARFGGAETAFADMCIAMHEKGITQEVITRKHPERLKRLTDAGLKVYCLPFGGKLDIYTPYRISQIIADFQPDIVQTWMSRAADKIPAKKKGQKHHVFSRLGGYYKLKYFKNTNYFTTITPKIRDYLIHEGVPADHVTHINNFAETEAATTAVSRASLDTPEDAYVLLTLARYHTSKALDIAIKAIKDIPDAYLWLAGEGPERENLQDLVQELGLEQRVRFLGWRDDRAALLKACDACIFASRFEPFGTVFVQAWEQDTPVIVSDADGPAQFVQDGLDALLVPKDNVRALQKAILKLKSDKKLQKILIKNGSSRYKKEFTKETCINNYLSHYLNILNK